MGINMFNMKKYQQGGIIGNQQLSPLQQMWQQYGFNQPMGQTSSQDIASMMGTRYGISDPNLLKPELFQSLTPQMIGATQMGTYNPIIEAGSQPLLQNLISGSQTKGLTGGFAGSGGYGSQMAGMKDVYGRGVGSVMQSAEQMRGQAEQQAMGILAGYGQTAQSLAA